MSMLHASFLHVKAVDVHRNGRYAVPYPGHTLHIQSEHSQHHTSGVSIATYNHLGLWMLWLHKYFKPQAQVLQRCCNLIHNAPDAMMKPHPTQGTCCWSKNLARPVTNLSNQKARYPEKSHECRYVCCLLALSFCLLSQLRTPVYTAYSP
jgi:hypothetical protein